MRDAVKDGVLDRSKAAFVANEHRSITVKDYAAVEAADTILSDAMRAGKIAPTHRKEIFEDVVANPEKWKKLLASAVPLFSVDASKGLPGATDGATPPVAERVVAETRRYMTEHVDVKDYGTAMRAMFTEQPALRDEYEKSRSAQKA
jgi:hypothetical protein